MDDINATTSLRASQTQLLCDCPSCAPHSPSHLSRLITGGQDARTFLNPAAEAFISGPHLNAVAAILDSSDGNASAADMRFR